MDWDKEARKLIPPTLWAFHPEMADALNAAIADLVRQSALTAGRHAELLVLRLREEFPRNSLDWRKVDGVAYEIRKDLP